jgi:hypothetical protein
LPDRLLQISPCRWPESRARQGGARHPPSALLKGLSILGDLASGISARMVIDARNPTGMLSTFAAAFAQP